MTVESIRSCSPWWWGRGISPANLLHKRHRTEPLGGGWAYDTDQVPDASHITPPVLKPGTRSGHDLSLSVKIDAGVPIHQVQSTTHEIDVTNSKGFSG